LLHHINLQLATSNHNVVHPLKAFNPNRLVRFHNNTKHPNYNQKVPREWHATTSIDVLSLGELREHLNELVEMHHSETKRFIETYHSQPETK
jgi:hypothetical protein